MEIIRNKATEEVDFTSYLHIMMTTEMLKYYMIFPKIIFPDFAVFYASEDMALELKLEIEIVLGLTIKYEAISDKQILGLIQSIDAQVGTMPKLS